jgi:hypothetical protein
MEKKNSERGQAIILLAISLVVLLGFTALAIDGSMLYSDRRQLQTAADASVLAGAGAAGNYLAEANIIPSEWNCGLNIVQYAEGLAVNQAIAVAGINGSTISYGVGENTVRTQCNDNGSKYIDVIVTITDDTKTSLAHFVYSGLTRNKVNAISRVIPGSVEAEGFAIATLDKTCDSAKEKGVWFAGTGNDKIEVYINGGGIHSNSCIVASGLSTESRVTLIDGIAWHQEDHPYTGGSVVDPYPQETTKIITPYIPPPACVGTVNPAVSVENGTPIYKPGIYSGTSNSIKVSSGSAILEPGLYCFKDGANFDVTSGELTGEGVTLYFTQNGGSFSTQGPAGQDGALVTLKAPYKPCDHPNYWNENCDPAVHGLLIYYHDGNTNPIQIAGASGSVYEGTIYARDSQVTMGGTSGSIGLGVQVIANSVKIHGSASLNMWYDDSLLYRNPDKIRLEK